MKKLIKSLLGRKTLFFFAFVYTTVITIGSLVNTGTLPKIDYEISDKTIHYFGYFFFYLIWFFYALFKHQKANYTVLVLLVGCFSFIYGIIIEMLQSVLTATRQSDIYDILANGLGVVTASLLLMLLQNKIIKLKSNI